MDAFFSELPNGSSWEGPITYPSNHPLTEQSMFDTDNSSDPHPWFPHPTPTAIAQDVDDTDDTDGSNDA
jgi:hypothetical protein